MAQMNTQNQTQEHLQSQASELNDDAMKELKPWLRWAPMICVSFVAFGTSLASPWVLWTVGASAIAGTILPNHPFDYIYNYGVRHLTGTRPLPPSTPQRRLACGIAAALLAGTGAAFFLDATSLGYAMGIGSKLYIRFLGRPNATSLLIRAIQGIGQALAHG